MISQFLCPTLIPMFFNKKTANFLIGYTTWPG